MSYPDIPHKKRKVKESSDQQEDASSLSHLNSAASTSDQAQTRSKLEFQLSGICSKVIHQVAFNQGAALA